MPHAVRFAPRKMVFQILDRGNAQAELFDEAGDEAAFERLLTDAPVLFSVKLISYCLMPDHSHLVVRPAHDSELGRLMQRRRAAHVRR